MLREINPGALVRLLHGHHVIPIACGGADDASNLLLLCPTHHALAHCLGSMSGPGTNGLREWWGPMTPLELRTAIELFRFPEEFRVLARVGYKVDRYLDYAHGEALEMDAVEEVRIQRRFTLTRGGAAVLT